MSTVIQHIRKRDNSVVNFDQSRITIAIWKALVASYPETERNKLRPRAKELSAQVVSKLKGKEFADYPNVEEIQNVIEIVLMSNAEHETAKRYIQYREQHKQLRQSQDYLTHGASLINKYLSRNDWRVNENSNMDYSLQGLNNHLITEITKNFWLDQLYPQEIRKAHTGGDFHIHDLGLLAPYCCGWSLEDLLIHGFKGVSGKIESSPARHFRTALGQLVNFFYTLQGEAAGAQAVSSFDTYLAPFVRHDKLTYKEVRQGMQEFVYNLNVPTRVGFQCMSEDTEILTENGWKTHDQVSVGEIIATFNTSGQTIEYLPVKKIFARHYDGKMYNLRNRVSDQLISPKHRVVCKKTGSSEYVLDPIENILALKSALITPVGSMGSNAQQNHAYTEDQIKLIAWLIADGSVDTNGGGTGRVSLYQSQIAHPKQYDEIVELCKKLELNYSERLHSGWGRPCNTLRFDSKSSQKIYDLFKTNKHDGIKFIPDWILNSDVKTSKIFIETYLKADGHSEVKLATSEPLIRDQLMQVAINAGYGVTCRSIQPSRNTKKVIYIIRLLKSKDTHIKDIQEIDYSGIIWCPNTENETVVARRNGKVFITGNTPFVNLTMDIICPTTLAEQSVIIGGEPQAAVYGEFQAEMDMINLAFCDVMMKGDASGRIFTFPIPTYNISKEFQWDSPVVDSIMEMTARYGIPYFANFVNSDMSPEDARSMAILGSQKVIYVNEYGRISINEIRHLVDNWIKASSDLKPKYKILMNGSFIDIVDMFEVPYKDYTNYVSVTLENNVVQCFSYQHTCPIVRNNTYMEVESQDLKIGDQFLVSMKGYEGSNIGTYEAGKVVGYYLGDGWLRTGSESQISFAININKKNIVDEIELFFNSMACEVKVEPQPDVNIFRVHVYGKQASGLVTQYVSGHKATSKRLASKVWNTSMSFRKGILHGLMATDGYGQDKIITHTTNKLLVEDVLTLSSSVGVICKTYDRKNSRYFAKDKSDKVYFDSHYIKPYNVKNTFELVLHGEHIGVFACIPVLKVETPSSRADVVYDFTVNTKSHLYELPNGVITHQCCRLRLDNRELRKRGGGLFGANPLTGSIGVVTINLARLGYLAENEEEFTSRLRKLMDLAKSSLEIKRKILEKNTNTGLYPYSRYYLKAVKDRFDMYWKNHFNTIGINGMNEAIMNLFGRDVTISTEQGKAFALRTLDYMRGVLAEYQQESDDLYNLEATPAEGTGYRLAKIDQEMFPTIITSGKDEPYYTNSTQLPVDYGYDLFDALDLQNELQTKYTGGTVFHGFLGEAIQDIEICKRIVRSVMENYEIPYFTISPTFSVCQNHGYINGEKPLCPTCGETTEIWTRVVGFHRPVQNWNLGKKEEFKDRAEYII